jgi:TonB-dependent starch-binding outer membrane protein SusC
MRKYKFFRAVVLIFCTLSFSHLFAQNKQISGTVTDDNGLPLTGATITVKSTRLATTTGAKGQFSINVPAGASTLVVSYIGMEPKEVAIQGKSEVDVSLKANTSTLGEVVVIGYGTARRSNVTTSISSVSEKDIKNLPVAGADQAIQGKVAGVTVTNNGGQPGGGVSVRIRGITNATGSNEPLYVIDGVQMGGENTTLQQNALGGGSGSTTQSALAMINPSDIASIDILKDASAQAIYGSKGANGVILITTKRGRGGEGKIAYDTYFGWQQIPKKLDVMNLNQYATYLNSLVGEVRAAGSGMDSVGEFKNPAVLGPGTDWQDEIYQTGMMQNHQLSFSGGQGKTNYYFSGNYFDQVGTLVETKFRRYNLKFNLDHQIKS